MKTVPGHNPENLPLAPGYRWLAEIEPHIPTDYIHVNRKSGSIQGWVTIAAFAAYKGWKDTDQLCGAARDVWSVRRALCVDDLSAPPPDACYKGYDLFKPTYGDPTRLMDIWIGGMWIVCASGGVTSGQHWYRRLKTLMTPLIPGPRLADSRPTLKPGQSIIVKVGQSTILSEAVQRAAFAAGLEWRQNGTDIVQSYKSPTVEDCLAIHPKGKRLSDLQWADEPFWRKHEPEALYLDARTDMGVLIDLLATTPETPAPAKPVPPTINGYAGQYVKDEIEASDDTIRFGCASINLDMLREYHRLMQAQWCAGNRKVAAITLDAGVKLTASDVSAILKYVGEVNA